MKRILITSIFINILFSLSAQVDFRHVVTSEEMDQVWADAVAQNKPVFVDIYATWCGPCKWLDANVFATEEAGEYMNPTFINVKMDGETEFGRAFAMQSGLSAYPSLFLFNSEKKMMNKLVGAKPWPELHPELALTLEYFPVLELMQSKYESGILKQEEYPTYTKALREMGKADYGVSVSNKYRNEFVKDSKWSPEDIQVLAFYTEQNTDDWDILVSDIEKLIEALGDDHDEFIDHAVTASIELAAEENDISIIDDMAKILPDLVAGTDQDADALETRSYIYFYHYTDKKDEMIRYIDDQYEKRSGDHEWLFSAAADAVFLDPNNRQVAEKGLKWFQSCIDLKETQEYYYHLALCQYFTDSKDKAVETLKKSLEFTEDPEIIMGTTSIIERIKQEK